MFWAQLGEYLKEKEKPVEEEKKEDTYETITPVELPTMPSEIPAQEPVGEVSASLFANAEPQSDTPSMQEQLESTSSIPMLQETDVPTNIPSVEPPKENNSIENFESLGNPLTQSNIDVADSPFIPPQINNPIDNMELNSQSNNLGLPEVNVPVADDQNKVMENSSVFENLSEESELQEDKVPMLEESNQNPTLDLPSFATDSNNVDNNDIVSDLTDVNNDVKIDEIIKKIDDIKDLVLSLKVSNVTKKNESDEIINSLPTLEMPLSSTTDPLPTMTDSVVPETLNQIDNSKVEDLDDNMIMGGKFL